MTKSRQDESELPKRGRGRAALPAGERRSVWIGAHVTEARKCELQARAAREMPGAPFADWLLACVDAGVPQNRGKTGD